MAKIDDTYLTSKRVHEVRELIDSRLSNNSAPGQRDDGAKLGLVLEGGGMRGVVSGGMVTALEALGTKNVFDGVYGASAGAMAGAYFLAGRAGYGTTIFYQCINNRLFINPFRFFAGKPVMSTSYLLDNICERARFLDADAVINSKVPLTIVATSITTQQSKSFHRFRDRSDLIDGLRAAITTPGAAGQPVEYRDDSFLDASVTEPIPIDTALADRCTHLLVCGTRPRGQQRKQLGIVHKQLVKSVLGMKVPWILEAEETLPDRYNNIVSRLFDGTYGSSQIAFAQPRSDFAEVFQLEKNKTRLIQGAKSGINAILDILGKEHRQSIETLNLF